LKLESQTLSLKTKAFFAHNINLDFTP